MLSRGASLGVSKVELRDVLLLKNSLLALLKLEVSWRKDSISSVGSLCPSRRGSCRCLCLRSLAITCNSGMPNTWGISSVGGERARQEDKKFIFLASSELGDVELILIYISHVSILHFLLSGSCIFLHKVYFFCQRLTKLETREEQKSERTQWLFHTSQKENIYIFCWLGKNKNYYRTFYLQTMAHKISSTSQITFVFTLLFR